MDSIAAPAPKRRHKQRASLDLIELQRLLMDDARNQEVPASVRAQVARAWCELQTMRRTMQMKPAPKPIDTTLLPGKHTTKVAKSGLSGVQISPDTAPPLAQAA